MSRDQLRRLREQCNRSWRFGGDDQGSGQPPIKEVGQFFFEEVMGLSSMKVIINMDPFQCK
jgi:hypothetical protein